MDAQQKIDPVRSLLGSESHRLSDERLLSFGCECCERLMNTFAEPMLGKLLAFARQRIDGTLNDAERNQIGEESDRLYNSLYPGYGAPSALVSALCAVSELVYTQSVHAAVKNASGFAAQAIALNTAESANDGVYDAVYDAAFAAERAEQAEMLRRGLTEI